MSNEIEQVVREKYGQVAKSTLSSNDAGVRAVAEAAHLVSAFVGENATVLGQLAVDCKENEIIAWRAHQQTIRRA